MFSLAVALTAACLIAIGNTEMLDDSICKSIWLTFSDGTPPPQTYISSSETFSICPNPAITDALLVGSTPTTSPPSPILFFTPPPPFVPPLQVPSPTMRPPPPPPLAQISSLPDIVKDFSTISPFVNPPIATPTAVSPRASSTLQDSVASPSSCPSSSPIPGFPDCDATYNDNIYPPGFPEFGSWKKVYSGSSVTETTNNPGNPGSTDPVRWYADGVSYNDSTKMACDLAIYCMAVAYQSGYSSIDVHLVQVEGAADPRWECVAYPLVVGSGCYFTERNTSILAVYGYDLLPSTMSSTVVDLDPATSYMRKIRSATQDFMKTSIRIDPDPATSYMRNIRSATRDIIKTSIRVDPDPATSYMRDIRSATQDIMETSIRLDPNTATSYMRDIRSATRDIIKTSIRLDPDPTTSYIRNIRSATQDIMETSIRVDPDPATSYMRRSATQDIIKTSIRVDPDLATSYMRRSATQDIIKTSIQVDPALATSRVQNMLSLSADIIKTSIIADPAPATSYMQDMLIKTSIIADPAPTTSHVQVMLPSTADIIKTSIQADPAPATSYMQDMFIKTSITADLAPATSHMQDMLPSNVRSTADIIKTSIQADPAPTTNYMQDTLSSTADIVRTSIPADPAPTTNYMQNTLSSTADIAKVSIQADPTPTTSYVGNLPSSTPATGPAACYGSISTTNFYLQAQGSKFDGQYALLPDFDNKYFDFTNTISNAAIFNLDTDGHLFSNGYEANTNKGDAQTVYFETYYDSGLAYLICTRNGQNLDCIGYIDSATQFMLCPDDHDCASDGTSCTSVALGTSVHSGCQALAFNAVSVCTPPEQLPPTSYVENIPSSTISNLPVDPAPATSIPPLPPLSTSSPPPPPSPPPCLTSTQLDDYGCSVDGSFSQRAIASCQTVNHSPGTDKATYPQLSRTYDEGDLSEQEGLACTYAKDCTTWASNLSHPIQAYRTADLQLLWLSENKAQWNCTVHVNNDDNLVYVEDNNVILAYDFQQPSIKQSMSSSDRYPHTTIQPN